MERENSHMVLSAREGTDWIKKHWEEITHKASVPYGLTLPFKSYMTPYLVGQDFFRKRAWEYPVNVISLFTDCMALATFPRGLEDRLLLLQCSIEVQNLQLCRSVLVEMDSQERTFWQKKILIPLIKRADQVPSYVDLVLEWEKTLPHDIKLSLLRAVLVCRSCVIAEKLLEERYCSDKLANDGKTIIPLLFLLARIELNPDKRAVWGSLFQFMFAKLNTNQQRQLLVHRARYLSESWALVKQYLDGPYSVYGAGHIFFQSSDKKRHASAVLMSECLKDFNGIIRLDTPYSENSFDKQNQKERWLGLLTEEFARLLKNKKIIQLRDTTWLTKEIELFVGILKGDIEHIRSIIESYEMTPNLFNLETMLIYWKYLGLNHSKTINLDNGLHSVFERFPHLAEKTGFSHVSALAALSLTKTLDYIATLKKIDLRIYLKAEFTIRSNVNLEELIPALIECALKYKKFWMIPYFQGEEYCKKICNESLGNIIASDQSPQKIVKCLRDSRLTHLLTVKHWEAIFIRCLDSDLLSKQSKVDLLQRVLDEQLVDSVQLFEIFNKLPSKHWLYQLTVFDAWLSQNIPLIEDNRKIFEEYLENSIRHSISVEDTYDAEELVTFLHGLFYFQNYPSLLHMMDSDKRESVFTSLFSKITTFIEKQLIFEKKQELALCRSSHSMRQAVLDRYEIEGEVKLYIGAYSVQCSFPVAKWYVEIFGNILTAHQLFSQCLALDENHPLYQASIQHLNFVRQLLNKPTIEKKKVALMEERVNLIETLLEVVTPTQTRSHSF